ncbi:MAG: Fic family protein [Defluviitaleaceae bacterium]|nr:Fic family protein [Defluviitaleaceae bacterium]
MELLKLDKLKAQLASMRPLNAGELKRLRNDFNIEFTYDTNAIEGSKLTLRETALILQEDITIAEKPLRMHLDAIGHRDAFEYVLSIADATEKLTERRIKEIHSLVLMNDSENRGVYRSVPVKIQGASHNPPPPYLIAPQMESLLLEYEVMKHELHIIEAISEFHLRFEGIHPFIDGNGRTGRLIMNLELIKAGFLPVNIKFTDRHKYYECFDSYYYNEQHKTDALLELIVRYELQELERYIKIIEDKNGLSK